MKKWQETSAILDRARALAGEGVKSAIATVVSIEGSAYRRPGARFLVDETGATMGAVSGGCLEADVRELALAAIADGEPSARRYETGGDDAVLWGLGLGCDGTVEVFILPDPAGRFGEPLDRARALLAGDDPFAILTVIAGEPRGRLLVVEAGGRTTGSTGLPELDRLAAGRAAVRLADGTTGVDVLGHAELFGDVMLPPPRLLVFGAGDDAIPLARFAGRAGFRVTVVDHRPAYLSAARFGDAGRVERRPRGGLGGLPTGDDTYAVVMTHNLARDRAWTKSLAATAVPYIGLLGPRARREKIADALERDDDRVYGPVGLDIGAEGAEQVALSVVAEILAVRGNRAPRHLRDRQAPIHGERGTPVHEG